VEWFGRALCHALQPVSCGLFSIVRQRSGNVFDRISARDHIEVCISCDHSKCYDIFRYMITKPTAAGGRLRDSRRFGFLLRDVTRLYVQRFEQHAASLGLTIAQCKALMRLADCEGVSQVRLAELTDLDPMTLVRILDRMESEGWLERRRDPRDRRVRCLYLTSAAKPLLDDIRHLIDVTWEEAFTGIPKQKSELVMELLDTVRSNFIDLDPLPATTASMARRNGGGRTAARAAGKS
jgi:DNA-binding MarR family transcriptional regulator